MAKSSLFSHTLAPLGGAVTSNESGTYALGVVVKPSVTGNLTSIWYYVGENDLGTVPAKAHVYDYAYVGLFPQKDTPYITEEFFLRNTIGWQEIVLSSPVPALVDTRYMISVSFPSTGAYYTSVADVFTSDVVSGNLTAEARATVHNGRFSSINSDTLRSQYPMDNYSPASYSVDVTFQPGWSSQSITHFLVTENGTLSPLDVTLLS